MARVALITCSVLPEPDPDQDLLLRSLQQAGVSAQWLAWDDSTSDLSAFDLCVLRSCWNYHEHPDAFLDWVASAASSSRLVNSADIVRWNAHKGYLRALQEAGLPIVPTAWFECGATVDLVDIMGTHGWNDVVIKPAVSAASFRTRRFRRDQVEHGQAFLEALVQERDTLVQRYMPKAEYLGERALVWIDGHLTHAVNKHPRFAGEIEQISEGRPPSDQERMIADQALSCVDGELLYARIDVLSGDDGQPVLSELELIEPSLFLLQCPAALSRLVAAIRRLCF
jgi:hypothetical protein